MRLARTVKADASFLTASTTLVDVTGLRVDFVVPRGPFRVEVYVPTTLIEEVGQQANYQIETGHSGTGTPLTGFSVRSDAANDSPSALFKIDAPNLNYAPTPGTAASLRVKLKTGVATSDVTCYAGDLFGLLVTPSIEVSNDEDGPASPTVYIRQGYTGSQKVAVYENDTVTNPVPVVCIHGGGAGRSPTDGFQFQDPDVYRIPMSLARAGFRVFEPLLATSPQAGCGNDASIAALTSLRNWIISNYSYPSTVKVGFVGLSMGNVEALNWGWRNPTLCAGVAGVLPGTDMGSLYSRNPLGVTTTINNAYGGAGPWAAAQASRDPVLNTSLIKPLPTRMWFSSDDGVALPSEADRDARLFGGQGTSMGSNGHWINPAWQVSELVTWASSNFRSA